MVLAFGFVVTCSSLLFQKLINAHLGKLFHLLGTKETPRNGSEQKETSRNESDVL
jgi:hypothetical protein